MKTIKELLLIHQSQHPELHNLTIEEELVKQHSQVEEELAQYWRQRAKIQWCVEGDRNTAFFLSAATNRRKLNSITHITIDNGQIIFNPSQVRRIFVNYFKELYCPINPEASTDHTAFFDQFSNSEYPVIPNQAHSVLTVIPTEIEIREALFSMGPDKSPGPNEISARFLQTN